MFTRVFGMVLRGNLRGIFSFIMGLALLGALWNASLYLLSSQESATGILTDVGIQVINPVLTKGQIGGLSQSALTSITKNCASTVTVPGLKVAVDCSKLKNAANLDAAALVVYQAVADSYYHNGIGGIFDASVPQPVVDLLSGKSILPTINTVNVPNGKSVSVPHLPDNPLFQLGSSVGLSFSTLTLQGHDDARTRTLWFGGLALALLLVIVLTSKGGKRLTAVGHALIGGAFPGVLGIGLVWFLTTRYPTQAASFTVLLNYLGKAFIPVYVGAALVGVLVYVVAFVWRMVAKSVSVGEKKPEPALVGATARPRAEIGGSFGGVSGYAAPQPRYAPQPPAPGGYGPQYPPRYPNEDPWAQQQQPPRQPPAGPTWPQPQPGSRPPARPGRSSPTGIIALRRRILQRLAVHHTHRKVAARTLRVELPMCPLVGSTPVAQAIPLGRAHPARLAAGAGPPGLRAAALTTARCRVGRPAGLRVGQ